MTYKRVLLINSVLLFSLAAVVNAQVTVSGSSGANGTYTSLTNASGAFAAINGTAQTGNTIVVTVTGSSISEAGTNSLNAGAWATLTIYPTSTGLAISGSVAGPLLNLNGADNVTIDGRVNATGAAKDLIITNTNTGSSASTIQFISSAETNTVKYCTIKGSETSAASGIISFSTASAGNGNDGNIIDNNNITSDAAGRPINAIYSLGSSGFENSGNTISNNNIYDFFNAGATSNGINIGSNSTGWTITGNSFYETTSFVTSSASQYYVIRIDNTSGVGFTVSDNFIGGSLGSCGGPAWTVVGTSFNPFIGIYLNVGTSIASSIQNNTIKNFNYSNDGSLVGIRIQSGSADIGTIKGNTIGATTGTGSITVSQVIGNLIFKGIDVSGSGTKNIENNNIGSITTIGSVDHPYTFFGIHIPSGSGTITIRNNLIGSTSTANSIQATGSVSSTSNQFQYVVGIHSSNSGSSTISNNTVANMYNAYAYSSTTLGNIAGIVTTAGVNTIQNNTIRNLSTTSPNTSTINTASVIGISQTSTTAGQTVSGNTIYDLTNTYSSTNAVSVIGLYYAGPISGTNTVSNNFVHSLSLSSTSTSSIIAGIRIGAGVTTFSNNIVNLGGNISTGYTIYGIYENGAASNDNNIYFNTVYIGGTASGVTSSTYALYNAANTNTRNFRNNILYNSRSGGSTGKHYAVAIAGLTNLTIDYNDYFVSGTVLGGIASVDQADLAAWKLATSQDANSLSLNPGFTTAGGTTASNYYISAILPGGSGTGITTDYDGFTRGATPVMGAFETTCYIWQGGSSTNFNTAANWIPVGTPSGFSKVTIPSALTTTFDPTLPSSTEIKTLSIQAAGVLNAVGNEQLTINGSNGAWSNAGGTFNAVTSTIIFTNPAATLSGTTNFNNVTINSGAGLTINASAAVTVNGTLTNNTGTSGLVIKSDITGDGKLLYNSSVEGTVELYLTGGSSDFHFFVPPVSTMAIGSTLQNVKDNLGVTNFNNDLMSYSESAAGANQNLGWQYYDGFIGTTGFTSASFSSLVSSKGYNIYLTAADIIKFKGTLNAAEHTFGLNRSLNCLGWNLVGNPYPCNYNLSGISALTTANNGVDKSLYYSHNGSYAVWNVTTQTGTSGYSDIVPPMQGFFVHVTASGNSLTLPTGSKTASAATSRSKGPGSIEVNSIEKIKLVLSNSTQSDETIVCLIDKATTGFDGDYDAYKLFGSSTTVPDIYTELSSIKYAINSLPDPVSNPIKIPVTVVLKTQGNYKIDITEFENLEGIKVVLKHGAIETNLSKDASYSFTSVAGTFTDFELIIGGTATGVENPVNEKLKTWYSNNFLYINCPTEITSANGNLIIYDMQGKPAYQNIHLYVTPGRTIQLPLTLLKGVYVVRVIFNSQPYISKIVVL